MNQALDLVQKPAESVGKHEPVEKYLKTKSGGSRLIKKTIKNKLGQKRIIFVKTNSNE